MKKTTQYRHLKLILYASLCYVFFEPSIEDDSFCWMSSDGDPACLRFEQIFWFWGSIILLYFGVSWLARRFFGSENKGQSATHGQNLSLLRKRVASDAPKSSPVKVICPACNHKLTFSSQAELEIYDYDMNPENGTQLKCPKCQTQMDFSKLTDAV